MVKRILISIVALLLTCIGLLYWSVSGNHDNFGTSIIVQPKVSENANFREYDSVLVAASSIYKPNVIKQVMQGKQYRKAWQTLVPARILFLDTLSGGVNVVEEGGGKQTHSLKLIDSAKIEYTLRSVNKDPGPLIPDIAKTLGLENIVIDGISAQHPYGAILAAELAKQVGVLHTAPKLVFLPKQNKLKDFEDNYGNRLFLLEYETKSKTNWTPLKNVIEIIDTDNLQKLKLELGDKVKIDKRRLIRARLFDLLIGDWDRHAKQFGWAIQEENDSLVAMVVPGDRDNAFFNSGGVIPSILSSRYLIPRMRPFKEDIDFMGGLVYPFDRYFLNNTKMDVFISEAEKLQELLTNNAIENAFEVWPSQISALDKKQIIENLKSRKANLLEYAQQFKTEIDKKGILDEPLKGSEDKNFPRALQKCFECYD